MSGPARLELASCLRTRLLGTEGNDRGLLQLLYIAAGSALEQRRARLICRNR
jgi:hypothetical protein